MRSSVVRLLVVGAVLLQLPTLARADSSSVHQYASATTVSGVALGSSPTVSVTINKPKKKSMLLVQGSINSFSTSATFFANAKVNGISIEPGLMSQRCAGDCTLSATWWVDLDDAELANPGGFLNRSPLTVTLLPSSNVAVSGKVVLTATLVKKGK